MKEVLERELHVRHIRCARHNGSQLRMQIADAVASRGRIVSPACASVGAHVELDLYRCEHFAMSAISLGGHSKSSECHASRSARRGKRAALASILRRVWESMQGCHQ
eukprot:1873499-Pleurochrysis_carterae.AAC.1